MPSYLLNNYLAHANFICPPELTKSAIRGVSSGVNHIRVRRCGLIFVATGRGRARELAGVRKGTNGVSTNGVTANFMFLDRGTFWVLPLTYFYLPKSARANLFPQPVKIHYLFSGPIGADPICPRPRRAAEVLPARGGRRAAAERRRRGPGLI